MCTNKNTKIQKYNKNQKQIKIMIGDLVITITLHYKNAR